ncbi:MAG TPA: MBL fold metallo-hydrolase [Gemmatimonadales bacterium]|nr:MBL fold metallo-hydrolase [Gemmatimonadales bacterium]
MSARNVVTKTEWSPADLYRRLELGEQPFVLDVRNRDEFANWKIEGRRELPTVNLPYFEILEESDGQDLSPEAWGRLVRQRLDGQLPADQPVLVVCAKGGTSALVAEGLRTQGFDAVNLEGGTKAWGDHYEIRPVLESPQLTIHQVSRPARGCLSYVVASDGQAVVIDALRHVERYEEFARARGLRITLVLDTHAHADHISGGRALADRVGAPYYLHPYDAIHPIDVLPATLSYRFLGDGQEFTIGSSRLQALHIPGHTLGNVAYLLDGRFLFSGDSIFVESIARPDLGGRADTWAPLHHRSLGRLLGLPDSTRVLPGHFSRLSEAGADGLFAATLGDLRRRNEGLRVAAGSETEFVRYILASLPVFPPQYVDIKRVNVGLTVPDEERSSELELGKNVCALAQAH